MITVSFKLILDTVYFFLKPYKLLLAKVINEIRNEKLSNISSY